MTRTLDILRDDHAPAAARHALQELSGALDASVLDDAGLLVTELVSNSVRHGAGDRVRVVLVPAPDGALRCDVVDGGRGFEPQARTARPDEAGGYGLFLVEKLSSAWGVLAGRTHVWFELAP